MSEQISNNNGCLKYLLILLWLLFSIVLAFYLWAVLPEYCACLGVTNGTLTRTDFWGNEVYCGIEDIEFTRSFTTLFHIILGVLLAFIVSLHVYFYRQKP